MTHSKRITFGTRSEQDRADVVLRDLFNKGGRAHVDDMRPWAAILSKWRELGLVKIDELDDGDRYWQMTEKGFIHIQKEPEPADVKRPAASTDVGKRVVISDGEMWEFWDEWVKK